MCSQSIDCAKLSFMTVAGRISPGGSADYPSQPIRAAGRPSPLTTAEPRDPSKQVPARPRDFGMNPGYRTQYGVLTHGVGFRKIGSTVLHPCRQWERLGAPPRQDMDRSEKRGEAPTFMSAEPHPAGHDKPVCASHYSLLCRELEHAGPRHGCLIFYGEVMETAVPIPTTINVLMDRAAMAPTRIPSATARLMSTGKVSFRTMASVFILHSFI